MTSQIVKRVALRNLALPAILLLALAVTAHAQSNENGVQASGPNGMLQSKDAADQKAAKTYINRLETDEQYQKAIKEQPSAKASTDPWGNVRPTTMPAAPAAKPAAKTATGAKSKPAVGNAASATSTTPKSQ